MINLSEATDIAPMVPTNSIMDVISRAAADPAVDTDKLERLLAMYERIKASEAKSAFNAALRDAQREIPIMAERGKSNNGTYTLWEDANEVLKPILDRHGFTLSFRCGQTPEGRILVKGVLAHDKGHSEETEMSLPSDTSGSKNPVQAVGSSTSYGKRYTAFALLNITSRGEDDDAKKAAKATPKDAQPSPKTAATQWADAAVETVKAFRTDSELSQWHKRCADKIASVRQYNESAHKRLVDAIHARSLALSTLGAG